MSINDKIREIALSYVGQKEISGNKGFVDSDFQQLMEDVGWQMNQAWCAYFAELVWTEAYFFYADLRAAVELPRLFNASAVATLRAFSKAGYEVQTTPVIGALAIWQHYKDGIAHWTGHAGIVTDFNANLICTCDGNTNDSGGREGIEVAVKCRNYDFEKINGLRLKGFIHPEIPYGIGTKPKIVV